MNHQSKERSPKMLPCLKPYDQTAYWYYRRNRKIHSHISENRSTYSKTVMAIYDAIGELMFENEGGVFLKEYGYFTPLLLKYTTETTNRPSPLYHHTDLNNYGLSFFYELGTRSCLKGMYMDRTYSNPMKRAFTRATYEKSLRPKLYYTLIKSLFGRKNNRLK
jgi:hypothetical protein